MRFSFSDEQDQFRAVVQRFMREQCPIAQTRRLLETGQDHDRAVWRRACDELGFAGVHVPETCGGLGFGFEELAIVLEESGRSLACLPLFSTAVLATHALLLGASETQQRALLPALLSGAQVAAVAVSEADGHFAADAVSVTARADGDAFLLDGSKSYVIDGHLADLLVVAARAPGSSGAAGVSLFAVAGDAAGLRRRRLDTLDGTRPLAALELDGVRAALLGEAGAGASVIDRVFDRAAVALACEMAGGARALLDSAVDYAKLRMQFGRPIGSFQAIKHQCADLLLQVELARAAALCAAAAVDEDDAELPALASLALATGAEAFMQAAAGCIQIHGGIGFTWEQDTHLWFRRARSAEVMLGHPAWHRERYLRLVENAA